MNNNSIQVKKNKSEKKKSLPSIANILQQSKNKNYNKKSMKSIEKKKDLDIKIKNYDSIKKILIKNKQFHSNSNKVKNEANLLPANKQQRKIKNIVSNIKLQKNMNGKQKNKQEEIVSKISVVTVNNLKKNKIKRLQNKVPFKYEQETKNINGKEKSKNTSPKFNSQNTLRERMQNKLKAARFRYLNEQLYTNKGQEAKKIFQSDPESFHAYHEGFRQQVSRWPMNPLDKIIESVKNMPENYVIADFGCGEAKLASSVPHKVHSFDLVKTVPGVIACDMAHCNLSSATVDVTVFCLSLMGTNLRDYLIEANRVLKLGGVLKIAEVESRFERIEKFTQELHSFGFKLLWKDLSHNLFYFMDFKKERNIKNKNKLPNISLNPCLYKKR